MVNVNSPFPVLTHMTIVTGISVNLPYLHQNARHKLHDCIVSMWLEMAILIDFCNQQTIAKLDKGGGCYEVVKYI